MKSAFTKKERCTAKTIFTGEKIIEFVLILINLTTKCEGPPKRKIL